MPGSFAWCGSSPLPRRGQFAIREIGRYVSPVPGPGPGLSGARTFAHLRGSWSVLGGCLFSPVVHGFAYPGSGMRVGEACGN